MVSLPRVDWSGAPRERVFQVRPLHQLSVSGANLASGDLRLTLDHWIATLERAIAPRQEIQAKRLVYRYTSAFAN